MVVVRISAMGYSIGKPITKKQYSIILSMSDKNDPRMLDFLAALLHYVVGI